MPLIIASRPSPLALCQAELVAAKLRALGTKTIVKSFSTVGDEITDRPLAEIGGKELFIKKLQHALKNKEADFAVHSLKDMAAKPTADFTLAAIGFAEDPRDVFISVNYATLADMPPNATIGTCSPRRAALIKNYFPHLKTVNMRGNVQSRIDKMKQGTCDALILAAAGLHRLQLSTQNEQYDYLPTDTFIPAPGQGLLALECLADNHALVKQLACLSDNDAVCRATAERAFAAAVEGDCHTPLGAHAHLHNNEVLLQAFYDDGTQFRMTNARASQTAAAVAGQTAAAAVLNN